VLPVSHTVVVKETALEQRPDLATGIFRRLTAIRDIVAHRVCGGGALDAAEQVLASRATLIGGDPIPYGVEANRDAIEMIIRFCIEQRVIARVETVDDLFIPVAV
jgi:4,5-dihydroxyphthalate decarboxylase